MRKSYVLTAVAAAALAVAGSTAPLAQTTKSPAQKAEQMPAPTTAAAYVTKAQQADLFEIEAGKIAMQRAQNASVKNFAQQMVEHHTMAANRFSASAREAGVVAPSPQLDAEHMKKLADLKAASNNAFDKTYMNMQVEGHEKALRMHQTYAQSGDNMKLKTAAGAMVPMVSEHRVYAQQISSTLVAQR